MSLEVAEEVMATQHAWYESQRTMIAAVTAQQVNIVALITVLT